MSKGLYTITQLRYDISDIIDFEKGEYKDISHFDNFMFKGHEYESDYFKFSTGGDKINKDELNDDNLKKIIEEALEPLKLKKLTLDKYGHLIKNDNNDMYIKYTIGNPILKEDNTKENYNISIPFDIQKGTLVEGQIIFESL